jgi:hypoxanthine phosphoribosyltransferase
MIKWMSDILIHGKVFRELIPADDIGCRVAELAVQINEDLAGKEVIFLGILNGAFVFAADLLRKVNFSARISFVKLASYVDTSSTGKVQELIGWNDDISGKTVVIIEDIVDTGKTIERIVNELIIRKAMEVRVATLFYKPSSCMTDIDIDYVGFEIPNDFVIGYGLDYNGMGRNLPSVYSLVS